MTRPALRRGLLNTALLLVSLVVALAVAEFGLRLFFYGSLAQPDYGQAFHEPHETRGWTLRPNTVASKQELDYKVPISINSLGLRGPEIGYERTPGVFRILIVADSAIFGSGVDDAHTVPVMLTELLAPLEVEVINLSVAAYSTTEEYALFMEEGRKYRPDLVLLGFAPGNDIQTSYEPLQRLFQKSQRRPYASLDAAGRLVIDYKYAEQEAERRTAMTAPGPIEHFFENAVLVRLVEAAVDKLKGGKRVDPNIFLGWPYLATFDESLGLDGRTRADSEKLWGDGWRVTQALIRDIQAQSRAMGAGFAVFVSPSKLQGEPETQARVQEAFPGVKLDVGKIDREMERFAGEIGAPFIPVLPAIQAATASSAEPLFFSFQDEHWTIAGNRVVAGALAKGLRANGLLPAGGNLSENVQ
jgi:hypothetical protein